MYFSVRSVNCFISITLMITGALFDLTSSMLCWSLCMIHWSIILLFS
jgi:hypothetical protein